MPKRPDVATIDPAAATAATASEPPAGYGTQEPIPVDSSKQPVSSVIEGTAVSSPAAAAAQDAIAAVGPGRPAVKVDTKAQKKPPTKKGNSLEAVLALGSPFFTDQEEVEKVLKQVPQVPQCSALEGEVFCVADGCDIIIKEAVERRIDPKLGSRSVTFVEMCGEPTDQELSEERKEELKSYWETLRLAKAQVLRVLKGHAGPVTCLREDPTGGAVFSGSKDNTIKKWDPRTGAIIATLEGHTNVITCVLCWKDMLISSSGDGTIRTWALDDCHELNTLRGHRLIVMTMVLHESKGVLFSGSADRTIRKWDLKSGELLATLAGHDMPVTCLEIREEKGFLFSGEWQLQVFKQWNLESGELVASQKISENKNTAIVF